MSTTEWPRATMYDAEAPTSRRALEELARPKVREILIRIAKLYTHSDADAEDLFVDALLLALDPEDSPLNDDDAPAA